MNTTRFLEIAKAICANAKLPVLLSHLDTCFKNDQSALPQLQESLLAQLFSTREQIYLMGLNKEFKDVLKHFGLENQFSPATLSPIIVIVQQVNRANLHTSINAGQPLFITLYRTVQTFIQCVNALSDLVDAPRKELKREGMAIMDIEVLDLGNGFTISRIQTVLTLIQSTYEQMARIYKVNPEDISLAFFDSGSGFLIGVKGDEKTIKAITAMFVTFWDKIRFFKIEKGKKKLEAIDENLAVLIKLREQEQSGVITHEDADRYSTILYGNVTELVGNGAVPREILSAEMLDNRELLRAKVEPKLLAQPPNLTISTSSAIPLPAPSDPPTPGQKKEG